MRTLNFILEDIPDEEQKLGLIRKVKNIPDHEFIFQINFANTFCFARTKDLHHCGEYYDYHFAQYEGYDKINKNCIKIIRNKSVASILKKEVSELFLKEEKEKFLLDKYKVIDYIIKSSDGINDFSLILLPEFLAFEVQEYILSSDVELYQMLQYYE